jgi:hypothetical protein
MTDDFPDGRHPLQATLSAAEIDTALNRAPAVPWDRKLTERVLIGGVAVNIHLAEGHPPNADQGSVLDPAADQDEPEEHQAKVAYWKAKAVYAPTAYEYERAVAHVTRLTGRPGTAWEQEVLHRTTAAIVRGDLKAHEQEIAVAPCIEPIVPKTCKVTYRKILTRDLTSGDIGTVVSWDEDVPVGEDGKPVFPPGPPTPTP